jgi:hypothetical protein
VLLRLVPLHQVLVRQQHPGHCIQPGGHRAPEPGLRADGRDPTRRCAPCMHAACMARCMRCRMWGAASAAWVRGLRGHAACRASTTPTHARDCQHARMCWHAPNTRTLDARVRCNVPCTHPSPAMRCTTTRARAGLFFYDIFWVFCTPVMVAVAKNIDAPIKLLFPRLLDAAAVAGAKRPMSMLGLGDIVIPGIFVALMLRYDVQVRLAGGVHVHVLACVRSRVRVCTLTWRPAACGPTRACAHTHAHTNTLARRTASAPSTSSRASSATCSACAPPSLS